MTHHLDTNHKTEQPRTITYVGDYEVLGEISRDANGAVYKARQLKLNRTVAVRLIGSDVLNTEEAITRFYRDAQVAATLEHPGIVPIYEVGQHDGTHYLATGYVEGPTLDQRINKGVMPPAAAAEVARQIAEAIAYAHRRGVIHGDLQPASVMLDITGQPKVSGFPFSWTRQQDGEQARTDTLTGTPGYRSPDQSAGTGGLIQTQANLYSLGAILYFLLCGRTPFPSATSRDTASKGTDKGPPVPLHMLNRSVPTDLEAICNTCFRTAPDMRYASAQDVADDLSRWLKGEPIQARAGSGGEQIRKWGQRNKVAAFFGVATLLSILIGSLVSLGFAIQANRASRLATASQTSLERAQAVTNFQLAVANIDHGRSVAAIANLEAIPQSYRNVEWRFARRQLSGSGRLCYLHKDEEIKQLAVNRSGSLIASLGFQKIVVFDVAANAIVNTIPWNDKSLLQSVTFSPDGRQLLLGVYSYGLNDDKPADKKRLSLWSLAENNEKLGIKCEDELGSVAFSPDGRVIAGAPSRSWSSSSRKPLPRIWVWSAESGAILREITTDGYCDQLRFSENGETIYANNAGTVYAVDLDGDTLKPLHRGDFLSPDRKYAINQPYDETPEILSVKDSAAKPIQSVSSKLDQIQFSPDSSMVVAIENQRKIAIWDVTSGGKIFESSLEPSAIKAVRPLPNGFQFVTAHENGLVKIWELDSLRPGLRRFSQEECGFLCRPPGSTKYWGLVKDALCAWDCASGKRSTRITIPNASATVFGISSDNIAISRDGTKALVCLNASLSRSGQPLGRFELYDLQSGVMLQSFLRNEKFTPSIAFSPDEKQAICVTKDGTIKSWDIESGKVAQEFVPRDSEGKVDSSKKAQQIVFASGNQGLFMFAFPHLYYLEKGLSSNESTGLTLLEKSNVITTGITTNAKLITSADGRRLAVTTSNAFAVYDTNSLKMVCAIPDVDTDVGELESCTFSPDGTRLLTLHSRAKVSTMLVWSVADGREVLRVKVPGDRRSGRMVFDDNGDGLAVSTNEGIYHFDLSEGNAEVKQADLAEIKEREQLWHTEQLASARKKGDSQSEVFHLAWLLQSDPNDGWRYDDLHEVVERISTNGSEDLEFGAGVRDILKLPRGNMLPQLTKERADEIARTTWQLVDSAPSDDLQRTLTSRAWRRKVSDMCEQYPKEGRFNILAACDIRRGEPREAIEVLNRSINAFSEKTPNWSRFATYALLALAHAQLEQGDLAKQAWEQVSKLTESSELLSLESLYIEARTAVFGADRMSAPQPLVDFNSEGSFDRLVSQRWELTGDANYHRCDQQAKSGSCSMHLRKGDSDGIAISKRIAVTPSTRYRFTAWCRATQNANDSTETDPDAKSPALAFRFMDAQDVIANTNVTDMGDWKQVTLDFESRPEQAFVTLGIRFESGKSSQLSDVWIDDFELKEVEKTTPPGCGTQR